MSEDLGWLFPPLNGGEDRGWNDAGIATFHEWDRLARETCQNIIDARRNDDEPALATFEMLAIPSAQLPGTKSLRRAFECIEREALNTLGRESEDYVAARHALDVLESSPIRILRIRDRNTVGLQGTDQDEQSRWYRLIRSQGRARMEGVAGGTYGIGQRAPFHFSDLRALLYVTVTEGEGFRAIGKAVLASFRDLKTGIKRQNVGFFGGLAGDGEPVVAIRDPKHLPEQLRRPRDLTGTDLCILGFNREGWLEDIRDSILIHFFAAIDHGILAVDIRDSTRNPARPICIMDKKTLDGCFDEAIQAAETGQDDRRKSLVHARCYLAAIRDPEGGAPRERDIPHIGRAQLFLKLGLREQAPRRIVRMRRPRIVLDPNRRRTWGTSQLDYAGVLLVDNKKGNRFLARLEDPAHKEWKVDHAPRYGFRLEDAKEVLNALKRFEIESVRELLDRSKEAEEDFVHTADLLPADMDPLEVSGEDGRGRGNGEVAGYGPGSASELEVLVHPEPRHMNRPVAEPGPGDDGEEGASGAGGHNQGTDGTMAGEGEEGAGGSGTCGGGAEETSAFRLGPGQLTLRSFPLGEDASRYRVVLRSSRPGAARIRLGAVEEGGRPSVLGVRGIRAVDKGGQPEILEGNCIAIPFDETRLRVLEVEVETPVPLALTLLE